jgi:hypothetical protein
LPKQFLLRRGFEKRRGLVASCNALVIVLRHA